MGRERDPATSTSPPRTVQHHASIWDPGASREHLAIRQGAHGDQEGWEYKYRYPVNDVIGGRGGIGARCVCGESVCVGGNGYSRGNFGLEQKERRDRRAKVKEKQTNIRKVDV